MIDIRDTAYEPKSGARVQVHEGTDIVADRTDECLLRAFRTLKSVTRTGGGKTVLSILLNARRKREIEVIEVCHRMGESSGVRTR